MTNSWRDPSWWRENFGSAIDEKDGQPWRGGASGLTPLNFDLLLATRPTLAEYKNKISADNYQRYNLHGFTTGELLALNAITDEELQPNNLEGELHPLIARKNWETEVPAHFDRKEFITTRGEIPGGFNGSWTAQDEKVWDVLMPSLQLVSKFLDNADIFPIFEALLNPTLEQVSKHDIWPWWGGKDRTAQEVANLPDLYRFRLQRHGYYENVDFATVQDLLVQLSRKVRLGIFDGACSVGEIQPEEPGRARNHGVTTRSNDDPEDLIRLYVSWQRIASLMREDLTTSMRLAEQFVLALTILHEIGHCIRYWKFPGPHHLEPYFEDDRLAEVGYALEKAIFGQTIVELVQNDRASTETDHFTVPVPGFVLKSWPTEYNHQNCYGPPLLDKNGNMLWNEDGDVAEENWPLSIAYVEEIQQENFWRYCVPLLGAGFVKGWPLVARSTHLKGGEYREAEVIAKQRIEEEEEWESWVRNVSTGRLLKFSWEYKTAYTFALERVRKTEEIKYAFNSYKANRARYRRLAEGKGPKVRILHRQSAPNNQLLSPPDEVVRPLTWQSPAGTNAGQRFRRKKKISTIVQDHRSGKKRKWPSSTVDDRATKRQATDQRGVLSVWNQAWTSISGYFGGGPREEP